MKHTKNKTEVIKKGKCNLYPGENVANKSVSGPRGWIQQTMTSK